MTTVTSVPVCVNTAFRPTAGMLQVAVAPLLDPASLRASGALASLTIGESLPPIDGVTVTTPSVKSRPSSKLPPCPPAEASGARPPLPDEPPLPPAAADDPPAPLPPDVAPPVPPLGAPPLPPCPPVLVAADPPAPAVTEPAPPDDDPAPPACASAVAI